MSHRDYEIAGQMAPQANLSKGDFIPPTDRQKLEQKKEALLTELSLVEAGLSALDAHPELEAFTKTLQRALYR